MSYENKTYYQDKRKQNVVGIDHNLITEEQTIKGREQKQKKRGKGNKQCQRQRMREEINGYEEGPKESDRITQTSWFSNEQKKRRWSKIMNTRKILKSHSDKQAIRVRISWSKLDEKSKETDLN